MARLSQLHPSNYKTSSQISGEFEQLIRYINAAELGNRTLGELLAQIFDSNGTWAGPIEFKIDSSEGLLYRTGKYLSPTEGWRTIAPLEDLRGAPGENLGNVAASPILPPVEYLATANQTTFDVAANAADFFVVHRNGILQRQGALNDYTVTTTPGFGTQQIVMTAPQPLNTRISITRIRSDATLSFLRSEIVTTGPQSVFVYPADLQGSDIFIYLNGVLQREGAIYDYTRQSTQPTITFNAAIPANNAVTVYGFAPTGDVAVAGLMLERDFVDQATGKINFSTLTIADAQIPAVKVNSLPQLITQAARLHIGASPPADPALIRFWLDTTTNPAALRVWDGVIWLRTSVENILPPVTPLNAGQLLKVNALGTNYELGTIDFSALIPRVWIGAANGVAALDSSGRLPTSQLPANFPADSIYFLQAGAVTNVELTVKRVYGQRINITGLAGRLSGGTANIRLAIGGVQQGPTITVASSPVEQPFVTPIEVDASVSLRTISVVVTAASSAANLEISLSTRAII